MNTPFCLLIPCLAAPHSSSFPSILQIRLLFICLYSHSFICSLIHFLDSFIIIHFSYRVNFSFCKHVSVLFLHIYASPPCDCRIPTNTHLYRIHLSPQHLTQDGAQSCVCKLSQKHIILLSGGPRCKRFFQRSAGSIPSLTHGTSRRNLNPSKGQVTPKMIKLLELRDRAPHSMGPLEMMVLSTSAPRPVAARLEDKRAFSQGHLNLLSLD